ncbi:MAG: hypothetical protein Q8N14_00925 [Candidatus Omnitrophota bacterium]|nr:hypothetical protein [Candidatus Omnitrophota bacterium]
MKAMGIRKALLFSFACHLFCFSIFTFRFDIKKTDSSDKLSVAFLGSILQKIDFSSLRRQMIPATSLDYVNAKVPSGLFPEKPDKPIVTPNSISSSKLLNKFVVSERKITQSEKEKVQDKYLSSRPSWERVNLKLKIE